MGRKNITSMWNLKGKVSHYRDRKRSRQNKNGTRAG